jgi:D,D-heptose 1,7-bisphosphate phosphatase
MAKAVFLDRDGTINEDPGYLAKPELMNLLPGVAEGLRKLKQDGFLLVLVTNQSGIGRGFFSKATLDEIHIRMQTLIEKESNVRLDHIDFCEHAPAALCDCRKPRALMLTRSAEKLGIDLKRSYMVGDRETDLQAGKAAGCRASLLVRTGNGLQTEKKIENADCDFIGNSLLEVSNWILAQETSDS